MMRPTCLCSMVSEVSAGRLEGWNLASSKCSFTHLFDVRCWVLAGSVLELISKKKSPVDTYLLVDLALELYDTT